MEGLITLLLAGFLIWAAATIVSKFRRRKRLVQLYGKEKAEKIIARKVLQGMTSEELRESWGSPADIDRTVHRRSSKETWKYGQTGKNRFKDRIFLENEIVVGWKD